MSDDPAGIEDVRRRLRERGYFDGPLERFVLGGPTRAMRSGRSVLRAALAGGPLLGGLLAGTAAFAARLTPGDFAVLWLYFSLAAALALCLLDLMAAAVATGLVRRGVSGESASRRGALLVALPTFTYLLLLWWRRTPEAGPVEDLLFLAFTAATVAVLGWLADLVSVARIAAALGQVPDRRRRIPLVVVGLLASGVLLFGVSRMLQERRPAGVPDFQVDTAAQPLLLVGIDGLDHELVSAFEPRGGLRNLLSLMERGDVFPLRHDPRWTPPAVWTTLATGTPPEVHGVTGPGVEKLPGLDAPLERAGPLPLAGALKLLLPTRTAAATGAGRRVRTLWEIMALRAPVVSVGWWGSWPAESGGRAGTAFVVTDRALPKLLAGSGPDRDTEPAALYARLASVLQEDLAAIRRDRQATFGTDRSAQVARIVEESHGIDAWNLRVAARLAGAVEPRAVFVYLPGLDILRDRLDRAGSGVDGTRVALEAPAAIEAYAGWLDRRLSPENRRDLGPRQFWLVAEPGRRAAPGAEGFAIHLEEDRTGAPCLGPTLKPTQLAPLVLGTAGFPASHEMGPTPAEGPCLRPPAARVTGFGRPRRGQEGPAEGEEAVLERLRSLGYLR